MEGKNEGVEEGVRMINTDCVKIFENEYHVCIQVRHQVEHQVYVQMRDQVMNQAWFKVFV